MTSQETWSRTHHSNFPHKYVAVFAVNMKTWFLQEDMRSDQKFKFVLKLKGQIGWRYMYSVGSALPYRIIPLPLHGEATTVIVDDGAVHFSLFSPGWFGWSWDWLRFYPRLTLALPLLDMFSTISQTVCCIMFPDVRNINNFADLFHYWTCFHMFPLVVNCILYYASWRGASRGLDAA